MKRHPAGRQRGFLVILVCGGTACRAAEHRVDAAAAKDRDVALRLGKRQGIVVEQHAALFFFLLTELISGFDVLFVACIRQGAVSGELRAAVRCASAFDAECMVDFAFLLERNSRSGQDKVATSTAAPDKPSQRRDLLEVSFCAIGFLLPKLSQMNDTMRLLPKGCALPFAETFRIFSQSYHKGKR